MGIAVRRQRPQFLLLGIGTALLAIAPAALASPPDAHCTCRKSDGSKLEVGETACMTMGEVAYLARCERDAETTTWRKLQDGCPEARLSTENMSLMP